MSQNFQNLSSVIASNRQSTDFLNEFSPEDIIVVDRSPDIEPFRRLEAADLDQWLHEYTLGELWQKNILGGRPS
jgi:hypothetical protein